MGDNLRHADTVIVTMGEYEWVFNNALVEMGKRTVEVWYEDDEGARRHVATAPAGATFVAWEGLGEFELEDDELEILDEDDLEDEDLDDEEIQ